MSQAGAKPPNMSRMMLMLPLLFLGNKINYTDDLVKILRVVYYIVQAVNLLIAYYLRTQVEAKKDRRTILVPPTPSPFAPPEEANRPKETTYYEHEMEQVNGLFKQTLMGVAFVTFIHFKWGTKPVLLLQSVMGIWNLMDHGLVKKYLLGSNDRVWGEKLEDEDGAARQGAAKAKIEDVTSEQLDEVSDKVFNKESGPDDLLKILNKDTVNRADKDGLTPLMVLSSRPDVKKEQIRRLLKLGADKKAQDQEGNTALHWAAMKGSAASADILTSDGPDSEIAELAAIKNKEDKTALALAKESLEPGKDEVLAAIKNASDINIKGGSANDLD